jgi:hypothetical protein
MVKRVRFWGIAALALGVTFTLGCQKKTDYLYFSKNDKPVSFEHKLKETTVGEGDLDILWVIDNSGSMSAHQNTVIANMAQFVDGLVKTSSAKLRWKMGLISTDTEDSPYIGFRAGDELDHTMANAADRFKLAVGRLGTNGDAIEKDYDPIVNALTAYPNFLRPEAFLAIITVSDASEQSNMLTSDFVNFIKQAKGGDLNKVFFFAFANPIEWCSPTDDVFYWQGSKLQELLTVVHGSAYKLCDPNFGNNVANLGSYIASSIASPKISLPDHPILSTLKVWYKDQEVRGGPKSAGGFWEYSVNLNAIVFSDLSFAPGADESVRVSYELDENFPEIK